MLQVQKMLQRVNVSNMSFHVFGAVQARQIESLFKSHGSTCEKAIQSQNTCSVTCTCTVK